MKPPTHLPTLLLLATALSVSAAAAQLPGRLKEKVKQRVERTADRAADRALDVAEGAVTCLVTDQACIDKAERSGKPVVVTDAQGQPLPAERQPPGSQPPGTGVWANYDFVPGSRVLFFEDFTRDQVGNFPRRLEFLTGNMEVVEWNGARWLRAVTWGELVVPLPEVLPERFTIEFDVVMAAGLAGLYRWEQVDVFGLPDGGDAESGSHVFCGFLRGGVRQPRGQSGEALMDLPTPLHDQVIHCRALADGRYVKVYVNERRVANVPNANFARSNKLRFNVPARDEHTTLVRNIRIAASDKTLYEALAEKGRVATQGILFATGSDLLRPESTPVLKEIVAMLQEHAELKLLIEGHTDNVGDDAANLTLSDKRAVAVVRYLVERAGVEASRLEAKGLGESKPVGSNDTPEGRQQNRRVELVRR